VYVPSYKTVFVNACVYEHFPKRLCAFLCDFICAFISGCEGRELSMLVYYFIEKQQGPMSNARNKAANYCNPRCLMPRLYVSVSLLVVVSTMPLSLLSNSALVFLCSLSLRLSVYVYVCLYLIPMKGLSVCLFFCLRLSALCKYMYLYVGPPACPYISGTHRSVSPICRTLYSSFCPSLILYIWLQSM